MDRLIREASGVTCQERTREELLETLRITLIEVLEYDAQEAQRTKPKRVYGSKNRCIKRIDKIKFLYLLKKP